MKVKWKVLGARLGFGVLAAAVTAMASGHVPATLGAGAALVGGGLATALPGALQASGIVRAASPGQTSLYQDLVRRAVAVASAPAARRRQDLRDAITQSLPQIVAAVAEKTNMSGFSAEELGRAAASVQPVTEDDQSQDDHAVAAMEAEGGIAPVVVKMPTAA